MDQRRDITERLFAEKQAIDEAWKKLKNLTLPRANRLELEAEIISRENTRTRLFSALAALEEENAKLHGSERQVSA